MFSVHLRWAGAIDFLLRLPSLSCVARVAPIEPRRIEVVHNLSTNPGVVVIGHRRDIRGRALGNERLIGEWI